MRSEEETAQEETVQVDANIMVNFYPTEDDNIVLKHVVLGSGPGVLIEFNVPNGDEAVDVDVSCSLLSPDELVEVLEVVTSAVKESIAEKKAKNDN